MLLPRFFNKEIKTRSGSALILNLRIRINVGDPDTQQTTPKTIIIITGDSIVLFPYLGQQLGANNSRENIPRWDS